MFVEMDEEIEMGWFWPQREKGHECRKGRVGELLSGMPSTWDKSARKLEG